MSFKGFILQLPCHDCVQTKPVELPIRMRFDLLNVILFKHVKALLKICTSLDQITDKLQAQFPEYKHLVTTETIQAIIRLNYGIEPIPIKATDDRIRIERNYGIFIDEATISINTYDTTRPLPIYIMCAVSSKGIQKLSINLLPHCAIEFTTSLLKKLKTKTVPFQIIAKPAIYQKIQALFSCQTCIHSLMTFSTCSVPNPAKKCVLRLSALLPENSHIHSPQDVEQLFKTTDIPPVNCKGWIQRFLCNC
ncbi:hypothetical protein HPULCUR_007612 [Helicostylum pulchrum]|uniref:Uncharacterized protein n=1 Tax=Helicostylum pulchrum TaxID=562976 RepID=A0ABP9Y5B4_9FUNG